MTGLRGRAAASLHSLPMARVAIFSYFALWSCARTSASRRFAHTARPTSERGGGGEMRAELRCRVCERTQPLAPIAACPDCDGPLDVGYGLDAVVLRRERRSMWRYEDLLPHRARRCGHAGDDAAGAGAAPLERARRRAPAEAGEREPDPLLQGPHRRHRGLGGACVRAADALLRLDRQPRRGRRRSRGCRRHGGGRARSVRPPRGRADRVVRRARPRRRRLVRRLPAARGGARGAVPVGLPRRQPAARSPRRARRRSPTRSSSSSTGRCRTPSSRPSRPGVLFSKLAQGFAEAKAVGTGRGQHAEAVRRAGRRLPAARGSVGRRPAALTRPPADRGALARGRRPSLRRPRRRRGAHVGRRDPPGSRGRDRRPHGAPRRDDGDPRRLGRRRCARHADRADPRRHASSRASASSSSSPAPG